MAISLPALNDIDPPAIPDHAPDADWYMVPTNMLVLVAEDK